MKGGELHGEDSFENRMLSAASLVTRRRAFCLQGAENKVSVTVMVDFGPAGKSQVEKAVQLPAKSTVFDALREAYPVVTSAR